MTAVREPARTGSPLDALPGRDLDADELRALVEALAGRPELWRAHVAYDDDKRHYASLHRDQHVDVWLLCWTPANDTGWHDHDISAGAVAVVQGRVAEQNLTVGAPVRGREAGAGASFGFGPDYIHRMSGVGRRSVTVHAYSPPLWRMGQYSVGPDGTLHRLSVSYADELRPLD